MAIVSQYTYVILYPGLIIIIIVIVIVIVIVIIIITIVA